jgi:hypothetical protein
MSDGTPWGTIHKQKELKAKQAELDDLQGKVKKFKIALQNEINTSYNKGSIDKTAHTKIQILIMSSRL